MKVVKEIINDVAHLKPVAVAGVLLPVLGLLAKVIPGIDIPSTVLVAYLTAAAGLAVALQKLGL